MVHARSDNSIKSSPPKDQRQGSRLAAVINKSGKEAEVNAKELSVSAKEPSVPAKKTSASAKLSIRSGKEPSVSVKDRSAFEPTQVAKKVFAIRPNAWETDRVHEKTAIDLLLDWISHDENYARWKYRSAPKEELCDEINVLLLAHGFQYRSNSDIKSQMSRLEMSVARAELLCCQNDNGVFTVLISHDKALKGKILQCCPISQSCSRCF